MLLRVVCCSRVLFDGCWVYVDCWSLLTVVFLVVAVCCSLFVVAGCSTLSLIVVVV